MCMATVVSFALIHRIAFKWHSDDDDDDIDDDDDDSECLQQIVSLQSDD